MTKHYALSAAKREGTGKGIARALRRENRIPAVIYGDKKEPVSISLPAKESNLEYNKGHMFTTLCELDLEGEKNLVLARDVQVHPVTDQVLHADFLRVTPKTKITVAVPVSFIHQEDCKGLKEKGILNVVRHTVDLVSQATNIPSEIEVDMTPFAIGDSINISAATMPEGAVPAIQDRDFTLATIAAPRLLIEEEPTEEAAEGEAAEGEAKAEGEEKAEDKEDKKD
ncbi:MAG: 50S ribosomal protein L25/general stress protein Ctc [Rhodospirillales bacterium]|nr:50S ribosomal protein L25/general stress protein Ctc [Alphaproteobacteria bacterium]USO03515.1 MAG: 50S ribosomal protein L25/general stress protein Ctc [Rhodospirillales bacterium]